MKEYQGECHPPRFLKAFGRNQIKLLFFNIYNVVSSTGHGNKAFVLAKF